MSLREHVPGQGSSDVVWSRGKIASNRAIRFLGHYEKELWMLTIGAMLVDITLTVHGLQLGLREMNPVARAALDSAGVLGLYFLKAVALAIGVCCTWVLPNRFTPIVPLGLAIPSVLAVVINTVVISIVLF